MKKPEILWIDDRTDSIRSIVGQIIAPLWQKEIRSNIFIVDDSKDKDDQIADLNKRIVDAFSCFLIEENKLFNSEAYGIYHLINSKNNQNNNAFFMESDVACNKSNIFNEFNESIKNQNCNIDKLINAQQKLFENQVLMIDMCLFPNDFEILNRKDDKVILSMVLYNYFKSQGYNVYIYSTYVFPTDMINHWKKIYLKHFSIDKKKGNKTIKFFSRMGINPFNQKEILIDILEKDIATLKKKLKK